MREEYEPFEISNPYGEEKEIEVAILFLKKGYWVKHLKNKPFADIAIRYSGETILIEIKNEDRYEGNGTIFVELYQGINKKQSGLNITKALICIHTLGKEAAFYKTENMKSYITENSLEEEMIEAGDNYNLGITQQMARLMNYNWFNHCYFEGIPSSIVEMIDAN